MAALTTLLGPILGGPKGGPDGGCGCPPPPAKEEGCGDDWGWEKPRGCKPRHHEKHCGHHH